METFTNRTSVGLLPYWVLVTGWGRLAGTLTNETIMYDFPTALVIGHAVFSKTPRKKIKAFLASHFPLKTEENTFTVRGNTLNTIGNTLVLRENSSISIQDYFPFL